MPDDDDEFVIEKYYLVVQIELDQFYFILKGTYVLSVEIRIIQSQVKRK